MITIRIMGLVIGVILVYLTFIFYKRKKISFKEFIFWATIWIGMASLAIFSNILQPVSSFLKLTRIFDLLFLLAITIILIILFLTKIEVKKNKEKVDKLIESNALKR